MRITALEGLGWLAIEQSDLSGRARLLRGDPRPVAGADAPGIVADALRGVGAAAVVAGQAAEAERCFQESLTRSRALGDQVGMGWSHCMLGWNALSQGNYGTAMAQSAAAVTLFRAVQGDVSLAMALTVLARAARAAGDRAQARRAAQEGLVLAQQIGNPKTVALFIDDVALGAAARAGDEQAAGPVGTGGAAVGRGGGAARAGYDADGRGRSAGV